MCAYGEWARECVCACVCGCMRERGKERVCIVKEVCVCVCVDVCVRETERAEDIPTHIHLGLNAFFL